MKHGHGLISSYPYRKEEIEETRKSSTRRRKTDHHQWSHVTYNNQVEKGITGETQ